MFLFLIVSTLLVPFTAGCSTVVDNENKNEYEEVNEPEDEEEKEDETEDIENRIYTFVFHENGADYGFDTITIPHTELVEGIKLPVPLKEGYIFDGWYLDESLTTKFDIKNLKSGVNNLYAKYKMTELTKQGLEVVYSTNMLDMDHFTFSKGLTTDGKEVSLKGGYTDYIPVRYNEPIVFGNGIKGGKYMRYITAYDYEYNVLPDLGSNSGTSLYVVPKTVSYIRISLYSDSLNEIARINKSEKLLRYEPFSKEIAPVGTAKQRMEDYNQRHRPFTTVLSEEEMIKAAYKPLGELNKPYFCLISDDGHKDVANYSIPMAISKGIPMTYGLMKYSEVLEEPYLSVLKDAIENHGFEVAQHGWTRYTEYTEDQLNYFFDTEKEYFDSLGIETKTAICPAHNINELVSAVASQRFEALRTGELSEKEGYPYSYGWYANGPTSNVFALDCYNLSFESLAVYKKHLDEVCENNWLFIGFYHENELNKERKEQIEAIIDYAKEKGMEFCTLSQIPHLSKAK